MRNCRSYVSLSFFFIFLYFHLNAQNKSIVYPFHFVAEGNPVITHMHTADPSCHVWEDGKLWMYCSHDLDTATGYQSMDAYHVFSTEDLKNWTDHGEVLHSKDVKWGIETGGWMWAPDCAYKNGNYYFYFPHLDPNKEFRIGVAISKKPEGPFIPEPDFIKGTSGIDPCCFIDDDGIAYLYFGDAWVARLKENMVELAEKPKKIDYGATNLREGVYMHKYSNKYYFSYTDWKDSINQGYYSIGNSPYGPFEYKGAVGAPAPGAQDHHSILTFKNKWYYFYHVGNFPGSNWCRRNICIDYLYYNDDGTMKKVIQTKEGVNPTYIGQ